MQSLNDSLKNISIIKLLIVAIILLFVIIFLEDIFPVTIPSEMVYIGLILFIVFELRNSKESFKLEINNVFKDFPFKLMFIVVVLNVFFSYGMIYLTDVLIALFPDLEYVVYTTVASNTVMVLIGSLISSIIIAPILEELVFRGIFLNRLNKYFSIHIAILVSSILFGVCHDFGGMFSAFVFGVCMCILYLKTGNIFVPMVAHALNNLLSEIISGLDFNNVIFNNPIVIIILSILAIISAYILFTSISQEWKKLS